MLRIGVLASHEGTTLQSIIDACAQERISGRVVAVISNNSASGALRRAAAAGIETVHLSSLTHSGGDSLDAAIKDTEMATEAVTALSILGHAGVMSQLQKSSRTPSQVSSRGARAVLNAPAGVNPMRNRPGPVESY